MLKSRSDGAERNVNAAICSVSVVKTMHSRFTDSGCLCGKYSQEAARPARSEERGPTLTSHQSPAGFEVLDTTSVTSVHRVILVNADVKSFPRRRR